MYVEYRLFLNEFVGNIWNKPKIIGLPMVSCIILTISLNSSNLFAYSQIVSIIAIKH